MRKKEFKVGDKVRITTSERNFTDDMKRYVGQVATLTKLANITSEGHNTFKIDLDGGKWAWIFEHGHFVSIDEDEKKKPSRRDKKKVRNVLKYGDRVTFNLLGKGSYEYTVMGDFMNYSDDTNAIIFMELGMSADEKILFCDKAYGYEADRSGQWPEFKSGDYEALTRCVNMLHLECNVYNKRVRDLEEKEV
jgi:hypothetical protein